MTVTDRVYLGFQIVSCNTHEPDMTSRTSH